MQKYQSNVQNRTGRAISGASVAVYDSGNNLAILYADNEVSTLANPIITDASGYYGFKAVDGEYRLVISSPSITTLTLTGILLEDPTDAPDVTLAALAATTGATLVGSNDGASGSLWTTVAGFISRVISSAGSSVIGFIQSGTGAIATTVQSRLRQNFSALDYSTLAQANTAAGSNTLFFPSGVYAVNANTTFTCPVEMDGGASFSVATGVTLTFNRKFTCGIQRAFSLSGTANVVFSAQYNNVGFPEWWGAVPGGPDCVDALEKCFVAMPTTQLQAADYFISRTAIFDTEHRSLLGVASFFESAGDGTTRILVSSGSLDAIQVGPTTMPAGGINNFKNNMRFEKFSVGRSIAPVISSGCRGILNQFTLGCNFEDVRSVESMIGFEFNGTVTTHGDLLQSFRSSAGTGAGTDYWRGYYVNGGASIGAAGGNASIYLNFCNASVGGAGIADSIGVYVDQKYSDTYINSPEVANCAKGIHVLGNNSSVLNYENIDLFITDPVVDQFTVSGIHIKNVGKYGVINITGGYSACFAGGTVVAGNHLESCQGTVNISGNQFHAGSNSACYGLKATNSSCIHSTGNIYNDCAPNAIYLDNVNHSYFNDTIRNNSRVSNAGVNLFSLCSNVKIDCEISGGAALFLAGVSLAGTSSTYNEINATRIEIAALNAGEVNKVLINSTQILSAGQIGTNLISGINNTNLNQSVAGSLAIGGQDVEAFTLLSVRSNTLRDLASYQYCAADGQGITHAFTRNRGTISASTSLLNNDVALRLSVRTFDGAANRSMGEIYCVADGPHAASNTPGRWEFHTIPVGSPTSALAVKINSGGNLSVERAGSGLRVKEGANAKQGSSVLVAGSVVVANTSVTANSRIMLTSNVDGGVPGFLRVSSRVNGTSFTITSSNIADTSTVAWQIFEPA